MGILIVIVAAVVVYIIVQQTRKTGASGLFSNETPMEILKKRYARGEISKEEFDRLKRDIAG